MKLISKILMLKRHKEVEKKEPEQLRFVFIADEDKTEVMPNASSIKDINAEARRS